MKSNDIESSSGWHVTAKLNVLQNVSSAIPSLLFLMLCVRRHNHGSLSFSFLEFLFNGWVHLYICYVDDTPLSTAKVMSVNLILDDLDIFPFVIVIPHRIFKYIPFRPRVLFKECFPWIWRISDSPEKAKMGIYTPDQVSCFTFFIFRITNIPKYCRTLGMCMKWHSLLLFVSLKQQNHENIYMYIFAYLSTSTSVSIYLCIFSCVYIWISLSNHIPILLHVFVCYRDLTWCSCGSCWEVEVQVIQMEWWV